MVVLGSSSPRRREILSKLISSFDIIPPDTDEAVMPDETAHQYCLRVACEKCESVRKTLTADNLLCITCDTTVSFEDHILGKPLDRDDAIRMISLLQNRTHQVLSGLAIFARINGEEINASGIQSTDVTFHNLDKAGIERYLDSVDVMDKAGAYAAQECGEMIIKKIDGSFSNVVGLPLRLFFSLLSENMLVDKFLDNPL
jgi:septum formation protein